MTAPWNCFRSLDGLMCARLFTKGAAEIVLELCTQQVCALNAQ